MPTLTTKALVLGLSSILGGTGVALGADHISTTTFSSSADSPESELSGEMEMASERAAAAHARRDARAQSRTAAQAERTSLREARHAERASIRADRPEPGEEAPKRAPSFASASMSMKQGRACAWGAVACLVV